MFYISLPFFYKNQKFNHFFSSYISNPLNKHKLVSRFAIEYTYGSFPWSYWNGHINNHQGPAITASEMKRLLLNYEIPLRLDASNVNITQNDYFDIHENSILNIINGTNSVYEISNTDLMSYIAQHNINNKFIISNNANLIYPLNTEIINVFQEQSNIDLINIGYNINNDKINLLNINNLNKIEISIGHCKNCTLDQQEKCALNEQQNIYNFSKVTLFANCPNGYNPNNYFNEIKPYLNQGITHFKIVTKICNLNTFNTNIIKSFIKPEYIGECLDEYYKSFK